MTAPTLSLRPTVPSPRRVLAVWVFCVATLVFWIGLLHMISGLPVAVAALATGILALVALPCATHLAGVIWDDAELPKTSPTP